MKKYRVVKETNNMSNPPFTAYVVEKHVRFLFWTWWSQNYLYDPYGHYRASTEEEAQNTCAILNGEKEWVSRVVYNS